MRVQLHGAGDDEGQQPRVPRDRGPGVLRWSATRLLQQPGRLRTAGGHQGITVELQKTGFLKA